MTESAVPLPASRVAWYATGVLAVLMWLSILDRFIISLLVGPIKHDLGISDVQFGVFNGLIFTVSYAVLGLGVGVMADSRSRRGVIFVGVAVWSLATAACGFARVFWQLLVARIGVGAGEATLGPCASSIIADLFPRERLASAMAVYSLGAMVGAGMAYIIGGQIVEAVTRTPHLVLPWVGAVHSWQAVFFIVGVPGLLLSALAFTFPEPVRRGIRDAQVLRRSGMASYRELLMFMRAHRRFFACHYLGFGFATVVLTGCGAWYAPHLARTFHWNAGQVGMGVGLAVGLGSITGSLASGAAVDALFRRGQRDAQMRWYMFSLLAATPVGIVAMTTGNVWLFLVLLFVLLVLMAALPALAMSALNIITPNELRGAGIALFALISGTLGAGMGPVAVAALSDYIFKDEKAIGLAMALIIAISLPLAALFLGLGLGAMRTAVKEADRWASSARS